RLRSIENSLKPRKTQPPKKSIWSWQKPAKRPPIRLTIAGPADRALADISFAHQPIRTRGEKFTDGHQARPAIRPPCSDFVDWPLSSDPCTVRILLQAGGSP